MHIILTNNHVVNICYANDAHYLSPGLLQVADGTPSGCLVPSVASPTPTEGSGSSLKPWYAAVVHGLSTFVVPTVEEGTLSGHFGAATVDTPPLLKEVLWEAEGPADCVYIEVKGLPPGVEPCGLQYKEFRAQGQAAPDASAARVSPAVPTKRRRRPRTQGTPLASTAQRPRRFKVGKRARRRQKPDAEPSTSSSTPPPVGTPPGLRWVGGRRWGFKRRSCMRPVQVFLKTLSSTLVFPAVLCRSSSLSADPPTLVVDVSSMRCQEKGKGRAFENRHSRSAFASVRRESSPLLCTLFYLCL